MSDKYKTGSVYIGVTGADLEYGESRDSIHRIQMRVGDIGPNFARGTKGYESRGWHVDQFLASVCDFALFLDADMTFEPDTLERLRGHGLPYVSGLYMRRTYAPIAPIWFEANPEGAWPYLPWIGAIERGKLHEIGASGWGCILVHRDVFEGVRPLLKGEPFILEDPMTVYPYDVEQIFKHMHALKYQRQRNVWVPDGLREAIDGLDAELRPLIGSKFRVTGSDIRFPYFANKAGFKLYGDPDVRCGHMIHYPLNPNDYDAVQEAVKDEARAEGYKVILGMRDEWRKLVDRLERGA